VKQSKIVLYGLRIMCNLYTEGYQSSIITVDELQCALFGNVNPCRLERRSCSGWHPTMCQPFYEASRKYHFTF